MEQFDFLCVCVCGIYNIWNIYTRELKINKNYELYTRDKRYSTTKMLNEFIKKMSLIQ